jgi:hypothetical protein
MNKEQLLILIQNRESAYKQAQERGDIFFPFAATEMELSKLKQELRIEEVKEWANWWDILVPKKSLMQELERI